MRRRRRQVYQAAVAGMVAFSLLASTPGLSAATPPPDNRSGKDPRAGWQARKDQPIPVQDIPAKTGVPDRDGELAVSGIPAPVWPQAGKAEVAVPKPDGREQFSKQLSGREQFRGARAGVLPVLIGPASAPGLAKAAAAPARVAVELDGRVGNDVRLRVRRTDGVRAAGPVSLQLDYSGFKQAFGGDWSTRLQLVKLPDCTAAACRAIPLPTRNDGRSQVAADVPVGAEFSTFALQAAASGPSGDATATSLSPTATWQVGGSSGDFAWSYPMQVPPSLGGPKADLSLSYSSGSVDGRTTAGNSQSSWAGAGFEFAPGGTIERKYAPCGGKSEQTGNNGTTPVGDYCWATDNATFALNGAGGELILDDDTRKWKSRTDDGMTVERKTGAANGDNDGEHWVLTDKAGTKFYFGQNKLPGATSAEQDTQSVFTMPVFGNHAGEPCHGATFAASYCAQAYRWNLDHVVDAFGNTMSLFYDREENRYARAGTATTVSKYTRSGHVRRIEYGQRDGKVFDDAARVAAVTFETAERCVKSSGCVASDYPDTPLDLECTSDTNCNNKFYPSFWTKKRLAKVTTHVWRGSAYAPVSSWSLRHTYLDPKDEGRSPMLWLEGITNVGLVAGQTTLPETTFGAELKPNRILGPDSLGQPALNWPRMRTITYGTGGQIVVGYLGADCSLPGNVPAPDQNTKRCHPIKWTPQNQAEREDWFHKYVVGSVTEVDLVGGTTGSVTKVEYLTPPAWRYDDEDGLVEVGKKTWSQWRGYEKVKVITGDGVDGPQQVKVNTYFRGMDGDKLAAGGRKSVQITDSTGATTPDTNALSGKLREQSTYDGDKLVDRSLTTHWISAARATRDRPWATTTAHQVEEQAVTQDEAVGAGWRKSASANTFNPTTGLLESKTDERDKSTPTDDTCTRYEYFSNPSRGLTALQSREQRLGVACDKPWTQADVLSDQRVTHDPDTGAQLAVRRLTGFDAAGKEIYQTTSTSSYDVFGRLERATDAEDHTTAIEYSPRDGGPVTQTKSIQPNGQTSTTKLEPAWGEETEVVDPAGRKSTTKRDALGRVVETWLAGNEGTVPNEKTLYQDGQDKSGLVTTVSLGPGGKTEVKREFSDGLMRRRQTQSESADGVGRVITDYIYDSQGREVKQNGPYYNEAPLGFEIVRPANERDLPAQRLTSYDRLGRPEAESFTSQGAQLWTRTHDNATGVQTTEPPTGEQATTRITDIQGRLVELRKYHGNKATGSYDATTYSYHPAGQLATVRDPAGNVWRYFYDQRGRKIKAADPDKGITTYGYDELDRMVSSTDARGVVQSVSYDEVGRRTAVRVDGELVSEWKYDTLRPGSLTSTTRYANGQRYTTAFTGYDEAGRPTGEQMEIPESEGGLAGTYTSSRTYNASGELATVKLPGIGGLPAETLTYTYDDRGRPTSLIGADRYVTEVDYSPYGETLRLKMERGDNWAEQHYDFDIGTHQLRSAGFMTPNGLESNVEYSYDQSGNVTKVTDTPTTIDAVDTQCFGYDHYRRLTNAWTPGSGDCAAAPAKAALGGPAPYWHSWTFDVTGNRKTERRITPTTETSSTYEYPAAGQARPHAVQKVTTGAKADSYTYDASGNLKTRTRNGTTDSLTWTGDGRVDTIAGGGKTASSVYDADGNRLLRKDTKGATLFFGDSELTLGADGSILGIRYYSLGDQKVAVRVGSTKLNWVSSDHHGTMSIQVDADSLAAERRRTTPYGETRGAAPGTWPGQRGFVGGVEDAAFGLVHLDARDYDPVLGKFVSVDPMIDHEDPQQLNAYAYANNSPVSFSDPDGQRYVIDTVTSLRTVLKVTYKRVIEEERRLQRTRVFVRTLTLASKALRMMGFHAFGAALGYWAWRETWRMVKIVKTIRELVKVQERVTKRLKRWVGGAEAKQLDAMLKHSNDLLRNAAAHTAATGAAAWAAAHRQAAEQIRRPKRGSVDLNLWGEHDGWPYPWSGMDIGNTEKDDASWGVELVKSGSAAGIAAAIAGHGARFGAGLLGGGVTLYAQAAWNDMNQKDGVNWVRGAQWAIGIVPTRLTVWGTQLATRGGLGNILNPSIACVVTKRGC
ncbi:RHS repeat-associated core domain-containing protein [Kribbella sandramycini]|uniref:RHS repeat-associated core domain-containing protein n=1 Tax=Kribbella sandramycini TaxID=60450 RepID=A0A7Y4L992_9ACTN|nr:RHS repeat-associated core domain-containing protein [Kribbella sandramycini]MBB6570159.1 RHS repeat-associated protein [Kribbella sandramycini]NOL45716.1 RHS repeat-associated core domain-containing protein [Kribbella sandramycini]